MTQIWKRAGRKKQEGKPEAPGRRKLASTLYKMELPEDLVKGIARMTLYGNCHLRIENYRKILLCTQNEIRLCGADGTIRITGSKMTIVYYTKEEMVISGSIAGIQLAERDSV